MCVNVIKRARLWESEWETGVIQYTSVWESGGGVECWSGKQRPHHHISVGITLLFPAYFHMKVSHLEQFKKRFLHLLKAMFPQS